MSNRMVVKASIAFSLLLAASSVVLPQVNRPGSPAVPDDPPVRVTPSKEDTIELVRKAISPDGSKGIVRAEENVYLVKEPPGGWLKLPGERIGIVKNGEIVAVLEEITVANLFLSQRWLKVQRFCKAGVECRESTGWVYDGEAGKPLFGAKADKAIFHDVKDPELMTAIRTSRQLRRYVQGVTGDELAKELFLSLERGR